MPAVARPQPSTLVAVACAGVAVLAARLPEEHLFRLGLILIFFAAALGLHVLFNWAGEFSLATASVLGLSTIASARVSSELSINPVLLVPVGIGVGAATSLVLSIVALRVRGLYVAVVTLCVAVVISSLLFNQSWLVGDGTVIAATPPVGGYEFLTSSELWPVLAGAVLVATWGTSNFLRSDYGRCLTLCKHNPTAAAAWGVNVARYRASAYLLSGALCGLAGGLNAMWVQVASPLDFSQDVSTNYLVAVVLAGPGSLFAVFEMSLFTVGLTLYVSSAGPVITYLGPIALILTLTRFPGGINQQNRLVTSWVRRTLKRRRAAIDPAPARPAPVPERS